MPDPSKYKAKNKKLYMQNCMHQTMHIEKKDRKNSLAICLNRWREHHPSKKDNYKKAVRNVVNAFLYSDGLPYKPSQFSPELTGQHFKIIDPASANIGKIFEATGDFEERDNIKVITLIILPASEESGMSLIENFVEGFSIKKTDEPLTVIKLADYPKHPDTVVINKKDRITSGSEYHEKDVYSYYNGVQEKMMDELKDRDLFVRLKTDTGAIYVRHPFTGHSEFIRIANESQFEEYNTGRVIEIHITMPAQCPYYVVDFDAVGDWGKTKKIVGEIADGLDKLPEVKKIEIRYTGKRGFHLLAWLKKPVPIDKARETLKEWLRATFGDRDDLVVGESPSGSKGALGVSPMKLNGGQVALWSLRVTGLCCVEVPRADLGSFKREDASLEKTYKKLTGKTFTPMEQKKATSRIVEAFMARRYKEFGQDEILLYCPDCHAEN